MQTISSQHLLHSAYVWFVESKINCYTSTVIIDIFAIVMFTFHVDPFVLPFNSRQVYLRMCIYT